MLWGTHTDRAEVFTSFVEAGAVRSTTVVRIGKLDWVVFPLTDFAD